MAVTGFASALTDIPLIALVQQRIADRHLAKAFGVWEAGVAGAVATSPMIAAAVIGQFGVRTGFMLSGAALVLIGAAATLLLDRTGKEKAVPLPAGPTAVRVDPEEVLQPALRRD